MKAPATTSIRILGIDPGLRSTGFGVIDKAGNKLSYVASGCIKADAAGSLPERITTILEGLEEIIATYQPQQAAVEIVFVNVNPQSTLMVCASLPQVQLAMPSAPEHSLGAPSRTSTSLLAMPNCSLA